MIRIMAGAGALALAFAAPAQAADDPGGDFLGSYTGPQRSDLDIGSGQVSFHGTDFTFRSVVNGTIGAPGSLQVWGINRGAGTPRLSLGSPSIGGSVNFDAVAVFFANGTGRVVTFPAAGAPTITPLNTIHVNGRGLTGVVPAALLPSRGFAPENYSFTLWSRQRVNAAVDGTNAEIADFLPNIGGINAAVPEPATWAMLVSGFGLAGAMMRRRRLAAAAG